jgi:nitroreductase
MELGAAIKKRKSVRKYSDKKPDWRDIIECIDTMRYAPMAGGNFTPKIILVDEKEKISKIAKYAEQDFIVQAKYLVVVCSSSSRTTNAFGDETGEKFCRQQAGAAMQNFLLSIVDKGLSACWVGFFNEDEIKHELKIPDDIKLEAIFPVGFDYEKNTKSKNKTELDNILYFNDYKNKYMKKPKKMEG